MLSLSLAWGTVNSAATRARGGVFILILRACEIARDRDCDLGQLTDRVWLSSGQRIRKTNHYNHYSDLRESDWEVDYYLRMRRAASPRAKVGRRGPRALLDARAAIHIIYVIYIRRRRGRAHPLLNYVIYPALLVQPGYYRRFLIRKRREGPRTLVLRGNKFCDERSASEVPEERPRGGYHQAFNGRRHPHRGVVGRHVGRR